MTDDMPEVDNRGTRRGYYATLLQYPRAGTSTLECVEIDNFTAHALSELVEHVINPAIRSTDPDQRPHANAVGVLTLKRDCERYAREHSWIVERLEMMTHRDMLYFTDAHITSDQTPGVFVRFRHDP